MPFPMLGQGLAAGGGQSPWAGMLSRGPGGAPQQNPGQWFHGLMPGQGNDLSGGGYGAQIGDINSILQAIQKGAFRTQPLDANALMSLFQQFTGGAEQRQASQLGQQGLAQGYAMGLQNPGLLAQRYRNQGYENFANQYGQAGIQLPQLAFQSQLAANNQNLGNILQLLGLRGSGLNAQQGLESQKGSFGGALGGLAGGVAGSFLGPLGGAAGSALGGKLFGK